MFKKLKWQEYTQKFADCEFIICIGAGKRLDIIQQFFDSSILKKIKYVADNDAKKQGMEVDISGKKMTVQSIPSLISILNSNRKAIVIITTAVFKEILTQLSGYPEFNETDIFSYSYILWSYQDDIALRKKIPADLKICDKMLIPKKIHYCWFGKNPFPERYKKWMDSWKRYCPDYEIIEWNEDNYDITKNKYMHQAYEAKKWGFVSDYARLDVIYNYGGIYLDTDVELVRNLDELLYQSGFMGFQMEQQVNSGLGFGAAAGNIFIKGMLDAYNDLSFIDSLGNMDLTPCPIRETEYLIKQGLQLNGEYQVLKGGLTIYPEKVFCGIGFLTRELRLSEDTFSIHHYDGSWLDDEKRAQREKSIRDTKI